MSDKLKEALMKPNEKATIFSTVRGSGWARPHNNVSGFDRWPFATANAGE